MLSCHITQMHHWLWIPVPLWGHTASSKWYYCYLPVSRQIYLYISVFVHRRVEGALANKVLVNHLRCSHVAQLAASHRFGLELLGQVGWVWALLHSHGNLLNVTPIIWLHSASALPSPSSSPKISSTSHHITHVHCLFASMRLPHLYIFSQAHNRIIVSLSSLILRWSIKGVGI